MSTFIGMGVNINTDRVKELTEKVELLEKEKLELETRVKELTDKTEKKQKKDSE